MEKAPNDPRAYDLSLVEWLERSCGVKLHETPQPGSTRSKTVATATHPTPEIRRAIMRVMDCLKPASDADIEKALFSLSQSTGAAKREEGDQADDEKVERYVSKCRAYPEDVVLYTLSVWDDHHEFFPRWRELKIAFEALTERRRAILIALKTFDERRIDEQDEISDDDRIYVDALRATSTQFMRTHEGANRRPYDGEQRIAAYRACVEARAKRREQFAEQHPLVSEAGAERILDIEERWYLNLTPVAFVVSVTLAGERKGDSAPAYRRGDDNDDNCCGAMP